MIHTIINPSDKYTIDCDDMAVLTAAIFVLGDIDDRNKFLSLIRVADENEQKKIIEDWYKEKQTSLSDIGGRAKELAKLLTK
jgi:hypothetical protein